MLMKEFKSSPCVGSGLCCKTGPCGYGIWLPEEKRCKYLETALKDSGVEIYRCGNYEYIIKQPGHEMMPAFGAGCCMGLFNTDRSNIIKQINAGNQKIIEILKV